MDERGRRQAYEQNPESTSSVSELTDGNGRMAPSSHTHHKILSNKAQAPHLVQERAESQVC